MNLIDIPTEKDAARESIIRLIQSQSEKVTEGEYNTIAFIDLSPLLFTINVGFMRGGNIWDRGFSSNGIQLSLKGIHDWRATKRRRVLFKKNKVDFYSFDSDTFKDAISDLVSVAAEKQKQIDAINAAKLTREAQNALDYAVIRERLVGWLVTVTDETPQGGKIELAGGLHIRITGKQLNLFHWDRHITQVDLSVVTNFVHLFKLNKSLTRS